MKLKHLYIIQSDLEGKIKIGRSIQPYKRLKQLQTGNPNKLRMIHVFENMGHLESYLHDVLSSFRLCGEWFSYKCIGSIPIDLYEQIEFGAFDNWWQENE